MDVRRRQNIHGILGLLIVRILTFVRLAPYSSPVAPEDLIMVRCVFIDIWLRHT
jgi:hypothetical protein